MARTCGYPDCQMYCDNIFNFNPYELCCLHRCFVDVEFCERCFDYYYSTHLMW